MINNPATIASREPVRLRESGLDIYIEAGDQDFFNLHEATEFLQRALPDAPTIRADNAVALGLEDIFVELTGGRP